MIIDFLLGFRYNLGNQTNGYDLNYLFSLEYSILKRIWLFSNRNLSDSRFLFTITSILLTYFKHMQAFTQK